MLDDEITQFANTLGARLGVTVDPALEPRCDDQLRRVDRHRDDSDQRLDPDHVAEHRQHRAAL
jgi:hypothetical protein